MPREDKEQEEEQRARTAYDLIRMRLDRLEKNIDKPVSIPQRRDTRKPRPPPDFVRNVVGSSAAAGSAEFHIFRNNRKREMDRLDYMNQKALQEALDAEYNAKREKQMRLEEEKTAKKRLKRQRQKEKLKQRRKNKGTTKKEESESEEGSSSEECSKNTETAHAEQSWDEATENDERNPTRTRTDENDTSPDKSRKAEDSVKGTTLLNNSTDNGITIDDKRLADSEDRFQDGDK